MATVPCPSPGGRAAAFRRLSGGRVEGNGTTQVGGIEDHLGEIRFVYCDAGRTIAVYAWDARRRRSFGYVHQAIV
jgi:hypothetical protein